MAKGSAKKILLTLACVMALSVTGPVRVIAAGPGEDDANSTQSEAAPGVAGVSEGKETNQGITTPGRALPGASTITLGKIRSEVIIPGSAVEAGVNGFMRGKIDNLAKYMDIIYRFLVSIVGVVAGFMIMIAGFQYLTAGGDANKVTAAKARIGNAMLGLILTLTSYVLLSTINPSLVQLNPKAVESVETKLAFLPWCDDLAKQKVEVHPISNFQGCGAVGSYIAGSKVSTCIYYGDCQLKDQKLFGTSTRVATCMQKGGLNADELLQTASSDPSMHFAVCIQCLDVTAGVARELGYGLMADACQAWQDAVNGYRSEIPNSQYWSVCQPSSSYPSCVQIDINCKDANDNEDIGSGQCNKNDHDCGCEGYDDQPTPVWSNSDHVIEEIYRGGYTVNSVDELDKLDRHLGTTCELNPCRDYTDDRKPTRPQAFINGCHGDSGIVNRVNRLVRHGDFAYHDCRNNNR
jgi:hypothetical protein